ncbi:MAG: hypothetical protein C0189_02430, partial [Caldisericum exile]
MAHYKFAVCILEDFKTPFQHSTKINPKLTNPRNEAMRIILLLGKSKGSLLSHLLRYFAPLVTQGDILKLFFLEFFPFFKLPISLFTIFYQTLPSRGFKNFPKILIIFFFSYIRPTNSQKSSIKNFEEFL